MKILFWVPYPKEGASNRYRVEQYLPYLDRNGIQYALHPFWNTAAYKILYKNRHFLKKAFFFLCGTTSRILDLIGISHYDIIFIHREAYPIGWAFFETFVSIIKKPIVFDFDDAIFLPASSSQNNFIEMFKNPGKIVSIIQKSSHVIAGNKYLLDFALCHNRSVSIIPTSLDTHRYFPNKKSSSNQIIIGWIGSVTTLDFLNKIKNVFINLSARFNNIQFKIVGGNFSIEGLDNVISKPWSLEEELGNLRSFDIGIMPMPDNEWTRGKCGFKAILCMSMGIPCVCSAVGMNNEIIDDGVNGFLAGNDDDWVEKLSLLINDNELRKRLGMMARKTVEEKYSLKVNIPVFIETLNIVYKNKYNKSAILRNSIERLNS